MEPPELTNFGSLLRFALALEDAAVAFYTQTEATAGGMELSSLAADLAGQHGNRRRVLERIRRNVNEMTLEPIAGLDGRRYTFDAQGGALASKGVALEEAAARFYSDSSSAAEPVLAEAARTFRKMAGESASNAARLRVAEGGPC